MYYYLIGPAGSCKQGQPWYIPNYLYGPVVDMTSKAVYWTSNSGARISLASSILNNTTGGLPQFTKLPSSLVPK